jgi:hypothetical protein
LNNDCTQSSIREFFLDDAQPRLDADARCDVDRDPCSCAPMPKCVQPLQCAHFGVDLHVDKYDWKCYQFSEAARFPIPSVGVRQPTVATLGPHMYIPGLSSSPKLCFKLYMMWPRCSSSGQKGPLCRSTRISGAVAVRQALMASCYAALTYTHIHVQCVAYGLS